MTADGDIETLMANVAANRDVIDAYLFDHFSVGANGVSWPLTYEEAEPLFEGDSTALYVLFPFTADVPIDEVPRVLDMTFDVLVDDISDRNLEALIRNDWAAGVVDADTERLAVFDAGTRTQAIDLGDTGWWKNFNPTGLGTQTYRTWEHKPTGLGSTNSQNLRAAQTHRTWSTGRTSRRSSTGSCTSSCRRTACPGGRTARS